MVSGALGRGQKIMTIKELEVYLYIMTVKKTIKNNYKRIINGETVEIDFGKSKITINKKGDKP